MKIETYNKIMSCLDIIEAELDKVAKVVGHVSYKEFMAAEGSAESLELQKAA
jgi:hypothetical protein|tara:strand:+ start:799 stop:954 length:156 start_codon:yes stop_codon:yes gene_type:complete